MQSIWTAISSFFMSLIAIFGFTHSAPSNPRLTLDNWWSVDFAKNTCSSDEQWLKGSKALIDQLGCDQVTSCPDVMPRANACALSDPEQQVVRFTNRLLSEFASNPECAGIEIAVYRGPDHPSPTDRVTGDGPRWSLQMNFTPGSDKQPWQMTRDDGGGRAYAEGEDEPKAMSHRACIIIKGAGAKLVN